MRCPGWLQKMQLRVRAPLLSVENESLAPGVVVMLAVGVGTGAVAGAGAAGMGGGVVAVGCSQGLRTGDVADCKSKISDDLGR